jgi:hypothetical protein
MPGAKGSYTNKKALVSEGFVDKQGLDFVGCGGKI